MIAEFFEMITNSEDKPEALLRLSEQCADAQSRETIMTDLKSYSDPKLALTPQLVNSAIGSFLYLNASEEEFYRYLWEFISADIVFPTSDMRAVALAVVLTDPRLPYHNHELLSLDEDSYAAKLSQLEPSIEEMRRIVYRQYAQKTEEASALLEIIDSSEERSNRVILLSYLLAAIRPQTEG